MYTWKIGNKILRHRHSAWIANNRKKWFHNIVFPGLPRLALVTTRISNRFLKLFVNCRSNFQLGASFVVYKMVNPDAVRYALGIIGNVISFGLFLSPLPTFIRIIKNRSIEMFKADPYIATILNCAMWVLYGLPFVTVNNILVTTINGVGLGIEIIYVVIFFVYSSSGKRKKIAIALLIEAVFLLAVILITVKAMHTLKMRKAFVGALCIAFNVMMYFSPLTVMRMVIKTKSVKYMPFWLSVTNFLNGACWTAYACIHFDAMMVVPNGLGTISGIIQLMLYAVYFKSTDWSDTTSAVELSEKP